MMRRLVRSPAAAAAVVAVLALGAWRQDAGRRSVTVSEGTSMSVAASPDGRTLAIDLQGALWLVPLEGGAARRITDEYNDVRQPKWSADGRTIAFQGFRDGSYDIWAVDTSGAALRQLTAGPHDDREPAFSGDGRRLAFASDRGDGTNYDIWVLDLATGTVTAATRGPGNEYMPSWSPDGREIAFIAARGRETRVMAVTVATGAERELASSTQADAPSWGPAGEIVYHAQGNATSSLERDGAVITEGENAFAFRAGWLSPTEIVYTADGRIRRRRLGAGSATEVPFTATLDVAPARYSRRPRDVDSRTPRKAVGIVGPAISPDGRSVAFVALGDLYVMPIGGSPQNLTRDAALDAEPAWSPDGRFLAWSSDRAGDRLDLWVRDMTTGGSRRLTRTANSAMGAAWSPDGARIAFLEVDGVWRRANVSVVEVATGEVTQVLASSFGPGAPTWSADGRRIAVAALKPYSTRFREGTNQVLSVSARGGDERWELPAPHISLDSRVGAGPVWSPDGSRLAVIQEGMLALVPTDPAGRLVGPPRRLTNEMAHAPSWTRDGRTILYQSMDRLRIVDVETGLVRDVPVSLDYRPSLPEGRVLVHASRMVDVRAGSTRREVDIEVVGNRIRRVSTHDDALHANATVVDGTGLTAMPGLIEYHTHLQKDLGTASNRAYLAFGVTTVRSPGSTPYEAVEDREAVEAGVRAGPRLFVTGYLLEWNRTYYKMAVAISSAGHLELELQRAAALQHDMIKSYVRMPDLQQRRIIEFAHRAGVPSASHEIYPAALAQMDGTEHTTGTSRRGYSTKAATPGRTYGDVKALFAATGMPLTPTLALGGGGFRRLVERDPAIASDPRLAIYPPWLRATVPSAAAGAPNAGTAAPPAIPAAALASVGAAGGQMVLDLMRAGTRIVAGTDTPNAATLHGELYAYVLAGMTPAEALRTATINSAEVLGLEAGEIAQGKLADLVLVDGDPLSDITATWRVRSVVANGRVFRVADLVARPPTASSSPASPP
jgi:Tol biopolymer transport system component/imidazolonepropionase-like amidohydrolase